MGRIRIGNSGWSYREWVGTFYPKGTRTSRMLDEYFNHFGTVEINSTFYRLPSRESVERWADTASRLDDREFCVKIPQEISHVLCMEEEIEGMEIAYDEFSKRVLTPLDESGTLGAVLFQASPYFTVRGDIKYRMKSEPRVPLPDYSMGMERLKDICRIMGGHPGERAIELRNSSWLNEDSDLVKKAIETLRSFGTALVTVDGPSFPWIEVDTSRHHYIRFHGRNRTEWFKSNEEDASRRYLYSYDNDELKERLDPIKIISSKGDRDTRIFFNNHPQGYAPRNASTMMSLLGIERPVGAVQRLFLDIRKNKCSKTT